ncbi:MAG: hypothetical protein AAF841_04160 [Pseudomonadota bacterium]
MRGLLLSLLSALVVMTSTGLGLARGSMPALEGHVICQGHAITTIWIDAQGREVERQALCPDAALSLLVQSAVAAPETGHVAFVRMAEMPALLARPAPAATLLKPQARAPPSMV